MTWQEYAAARQLLAEERVGKYVRAQRAREEEDVRRLGKVAAGARPR